MLSFRWFLLYALRAQFYFLSNNLVKSHSKRKATKWAAIGIATFFLVLFVFLEPSKFQIDSFRLFLEQNQVVAPFIIIGTIIAEVVLAPLPGYFLPVISGLFFGPILGFLYAWVGNVIGSILAFLISRLLRSSILTRIVSKKKLDYYHEVLTESGSLLWLFYIFPIFPVDIISFAAGFTHMKFKHFIKIVTIGFIPNMLTLSFFGSTFLDTSKLQKAIIAGVFLLVLIISLQLEDWIQKKYQNPATPKAS